MHKFDKETLDKTCASLVPCCDLQEISIEKYRMQRLTLRFL